MMVLDDVKTAYSSHQHPKPQRRGTTLSHNQLKTIFQLDDLLKTTLNSFDHRKELKSKGGKKKKSQTLRKTKICTEAKIELKVTVVFHGRGCQLAFNP